MPRVHSQIKSTRGRDRRCSRCGATIHPGERYYSWKFRYGGPRTNCHLHAPRPSELTQSKLGAIYAAVEAYEDAAPYAGAEALTDAVHAVGETAREVEQEYRDAAEAMGEGGTQHEERADELDSWADQLEGFEAEGPEEGDGFDEQAALSQAASDVFAAWTAEGKEAPEGYEPNAAVSVVQGTSRMVCDGREIEDAEFCTDVLGRLEYLSEQYDAEHPDEGELDTSEADDLVNGCPL